MSDLKFNPIGNPIKPVTGTLVKPVSGVVKNPIESPVPEPTSKPKADANLTVADRGMPSSFDLGQMLQEKYGSK